MPAPQYLFSLAPCVQAAPSPPTLPRCLVQGLCLGMAAIRLTDAFDQADAAYEAEEEAKPEAEAAPHPLRDCNGLPTRASPAAAQKPATAAPPPSAAAAAEVAWAVAQTATADTYDPDAGSGASTTTFSTLPARALSATAFGACAAAGVATCTHPAPLVHDPLAGQQAAPAQQQAQVHQGGSYAPHDWSAFTATLPESNPLAAQHQAGDSAPSLFAW